MHSRSQGRLDGASAMLHENGNLKLLAYYPGAQRQGPCRVWNEEGKMVLYAQHKDGKKDGVTCLLKDGHPWLVQEWKAGTLGNETVVARKGSEYVAVDDAEQLAQAKETLSTVEKEVAANESELRKTMYTWFVDTSERIKKEQDKVLTKVAAAQSKAAKQAIRQERDAYVTAAHTHYGDGRRDRVGRVAAADSGFAARDKKASDKNAAAVRNDAKAKLQQMNTAMEQGSKELYEFAIAALEAAMPSSPTAPAAYTSSQGPDRQKTFVVTYKEGGKKGRMHTDSVRASSAEGAKEEVRKSHPHAKFKTVEEK
jgi:hypothetical protein